MSSIDDSACRPHRCRGRSRLGARTPDPSARASTGPNKGMLLLTHAGPSERASALLSPQVRRSTVGPTCTNVRWGRPALQAGG